MFGHACTLNLHGMKQGYKSCFQILLMDKHMCPYSWRSIDCDIEEFKLCKEANIYLTCPGYKRMIEFEIAEMQSCEV